jgi:hypothetical protein
MITIPTHILKMKNVYAPGKMVLAVVEANPDITFRHLHNSGFVTMTGKGKTYKYRINDNTR